MLHQRTIARPVRCTGFGLHSGSLVHVRLLPAEPNTGIVFVRTDVPTSKPLKASPDRVVETKLATTLGDGIIRIGTVEHLMSAVFATGIDNLEVHIDGPEVPILDGSAAPFVFLLKSAGIVKQDTYKRFLVIKKTVKVKEGGRKAVFRPFDGFEVHYVIEFNHPLISVQSFTFNPKHLDYRKELARARTFGFLEDVEVMKRNGLALGGSLDNAVVLDKFRVLNPDGLRYPDEFVRHKVVDVMGDLALLGAVPVGRFEGYRAGHQINNRLVRKVLSDPSAWALLQPEATETKSDKGPSFEQAAWQGLSPVPSI